MDCGAYSNDCRGDWATTPESIMSQSENQSG
jgi:hypothetical protein